MDSSHFDLITIGGGMGASALAISLAKSGARVLVIEKETHFRDRVRGEALACWGVAEAKQLGIADILLGACARELSRIEMGFGPRNLVETTPQKSGFLTFCHQEMQEALLSEAEKSGAFVRRGITAQSVEGEVNKVVVTTRNGKDERVSARLAVAADGRGSACRKWAGFEIHRNDHGFQFAGVLLEDSSVSPDDLMFLFNPDLGLVVGVVPQRNQKCRAYLGYPATRGLALQGINKFGIFLSETRKAHPLVADHYASAKCVGPLATFDAAEVWVNEPYRNGIALLGDAAGTSDPSFGQGMSLTLRDARVLRDALLGDSDWDKAARSYAGQHDSYFQNSHRVCGWLRTLFQDPSVPAQKIRARAMPRIAEDLTRVPDHLFVGPDLPSDDSVRARFFGEI